MKKWAWSLLCLLVLSLSVLPVYAGSITVTTLTDGTGVTGCSLREAITQANAGVDGDGCTGVTASPNTINLSVGGNYTLTTGSELTVTSNITLQESGGVTAIIQAAAVVDTVGYSVFAVDGASAVLTLNGVTVRNGGKTATSLLGGCITLISGGDVTLTGGAVVEGCRNNGNGGAIFAFNSNAVITITNSTVQNSIAAGNGGGIMCGFCTLTLTGATISDNQVDPTLGGAGTQGGGIYCNNCVLSVSNSTFSNNQVKGQSGLNVVGGAISVSSTSGTPAISGSTFSGNSVSGGSSNNGGAVAKSGSSTLSISGSVFTGNSVSGSGASGGVFYVSGSGSTLNVTSSRIQSNISSTTTVGDVLDLNAASRASITGSCIVNNGDTAISDTDATNITTATGNWWGTSWGPQIAGVTGSRYSNGDSITGNGTSAVNVGWATGGNEILIPPTGNWLTAVPTVAGAQCMSCTGVSSIGHGRTCS
ncbi:MAG: CSLREA domain-containing protein [Anaerolinea sp.]|nr:CSLREA domain-containing protein [Anaerolinea sp.]